MALFKTCMQQKRSHFFSFILIIHYVTSTSPFSKRVLGLEVLDILRTSIAVVTHLYVCLFLKFLYLIRVVIFLIKFENLPSNIDQKIIFFSPSIFDLLFFIKNEFVFKQISSIFYILSQILIIKNRFINIVIYSSLICYKFVTHTNFCNVRHYPPKPHCNLKSSRDNLTSCHSTRK